MLRGDFATRFALLDEQEQAIIPVEQDTVPFYDRQIIAARLPE
jgi:hypothetical protein